jgi:hypothetical protein
MWVVITSQAWGRMPDSVLREFEVVSRVRGWWYVKGLKVADVLILRKRSPFAHAGP